MTYGKCEQCGEHPAEAGDILCRVCKAKPLRLVKSILGAAMDPSRAGALERGAVSDGEAFAGSTQGDRPGDVIPDAKFVRSPKIVPAPTNPMAVAREFVSEHYEDVRGLLLRHHRGDFYYYVVTHWIEVEDRTVRAALYSWLEDTIFLKDAKGIPVPKPFEPNRHKLGDALDALGAICIVPSDVEPPAWIGEGPLPASDVVSVANGLLHLSTRNLIEHTPAFFGLNSLSFDYDPNAPAPARWLQFLDELFVDDVEAIETLQEWFGYVLSGDTTQQKMVLVVGPKRSGKGTIGRVLTGLLGAHNVAAPTLSSLTQNFGLQVLIGKPLGLISDARLGSRADSMIAVERLLSISGEDSITVDRKYRDPWTGRLPTRFMVLTNEVPKFTDSSGALASRFVMLVLENTFYGREDPGLTDALLDESTGIFNWALEGLDRLAERAYFDVPASSREALRQLEDLSSPIGAYVRDRCVLRAGAEISKDLLFADYRTWCETEGQRPRSKNVFLRDLYAAHPRLRPARVRDAGDRVQRLDGIELRGPDDTRSDEHREQWTGTRDNPGQGTSTEARSGMPPEQTRRSEAVSRDVPGSSPLPPVFTTFTDPTDRTIARVARARGANP